MFAKLVLCVCLNVIVFLMIVCVESCSATIINLYLRTHFTIMGYLYSFLRFFVSCSNFETGT